MPQFARPLTTMAALAAIASLAACGTEVAVVGGSPNASLDTKYDYGGSSLDPLFTERVWFAQPVTKTSGLQHWIGELALRGARTKRGAR